MRVIVWILPGASRHRDAHGCEAIASSSVWRATGPW